MKINKIMEFIDHIKYFICLIISYFVFRFIFLEGYDEVKVIICALIYSVVFYFVWLTLRSIIAYTINRNKIIKVNKEEDIDFFKELRSKYSTSELYFIYSGIKYFEKSLIVKFYHMEKKGKIKIENGRMLLLVSENTLSEEERIIINDFNVMKANIFKLKYMATVEKILFDNNILKIHKGLFYDSSFTVKFLFILMIVALVFLNNQINESCLVENSLYICNKSTLTLLLFLSFIIVVFSLLIRAIFESFLRKKMKHYSLTNEGKELRARLRGLKKYIKKNNLVNDEDFADYLFILNVKSSLVNEITKKYSYLFKI